MCIIGIDMKSKVIIMVLVNSNGDLMVIKDMINGFPMPMNLPNHLFMAISFKLIDIKIVVNEVEHFTAINFSMVVVKYTAAGHTCKNGYIHGSHFQCQKAIYIYTAPGHPCKNSYIHGSCFQCKKAICTASRHPCKNSYIHGSRFKCKKKRIHDCRTNIYNGYIHGSRLQCNNGYIHGSRIKCKKGWIYGCRANI